jgi:hypothetical protein
LSNVYENISLPLVDKYTRGKIVTNDVYQVSLNKIVELTAKLDDERKKTNDALVERDEFERRWSQAETTSGPGVDLSNLRADSRFSDIKNAILEIKEPETPEINIDSFIESLIREQSVFRTTAEFAQFSNIVLRETSGYLEHLEKIGFVEHKIGKGDVIRWRILKNPIIIYEAKYGSGSQTVDVSNKIREMIKLDIFQGQVNPGYLGVPDPVPGTPKALKIHCTIRGVERNLDFSDGEVFQIR